MMSAARKMKAIHLYKTTPSGRSSSDEIGGYFDSMVFEDHPKIVTPSKEKVEVALVMQDDSSVSGKGEGEGLCLDLITNLIYLGSVQVGFLK